MDFPSISMNTDKYFTNELAARFFPTATSLVTFTDYLTIRSQRAQQASDKTVAQQMTMLILLAKSARSPVQPDSVPLDVVIAICLMPIVHLKLFGDSSRYTRNTHTKMLELLPADPWKPKLDAACAIYGHSACFQMGRVALAIEQHFEDWKRELDAEFTALSDESYLDCRDQDSNTGPPPKRQKLNAHMTGLIKLMEACDEVIHASDMAHEYLENNTQILDDFATSYWRRGYTELRNGKRYRLMRTKGFWALHSTDGEVESLPLLSFDAFDQSD